MGAFLCRSRFVHYLLSPLIAPEVKAPALVDAACHVEHQHATVDAVELLVVSQYIIHLSRYWDAIQAF